MLTNQRKNPIGAGLRPKTWARQVIAARQPRRCPLKKLRRNQGSDIRQNKKPPFRQGLCRKAGKTDPLPQFGLRREAVSNSLFPTLHNSPPLERIYIANLNRIIRALFLSSRAPDFSISGVLEVTHAESNVISQVVFGRFYRHRL